MLDKPYQVRQRPKDGAKKVAGEFETWRQAQEAKAIWQKASPNDTFYIFVKTEASNS